MNLLHQKTSVLPSACSIVKYVRNSSNRSGIGEETFSNSLIIHEHKIKKISSVDDVWKSKKEITNTWPNFTSIFSRNAG